MCDKKNCAICFYCVKFSSYLYFSFEYYYIAADEKNNFYFIHEKLEQRGESP